MRKGIAAVLAAAGMAVALAGCTSGTLKLTADSDTGGSTVKADKAAKGLSTTGAIDVPEGYHIHIESDIDAGVLKVLANDPEDQDVVVDDSISGKYEHDYEVDPGEYSLTVSVAGTEAVTGDMEIVPEKDPDWNEELAKKMREFADMLEGEEASAAETQKKAEEVSDALEERLSETDSKRPDEGSSSASDKDEKGGEPSSSSKTSKKDTVVG